MERVSNNNIDTDFDPNILQVNGPLNVARLEGSINGIKKVIYLFMDMHIEVERQTECSNIFSKDIQTYLIENFYNLNDTNHIYDFFFEITPSGTQDNFPDRDKYKDKYILEVAKFFRKIFKYNNEENKVQISDVFKNVRLHYLDIRDYFEIQVYDKLSNAMYEVHRFYQTGFTDIGFENLIESITSSRKQLQFVIDTLNIPDDTIKNKTNLIKFRRSWRADSKAVRQLTYKIKYRYNYSHVKEVLTKLLDDLILQLVDYINNMDKIIAKLNEFYDIYIDAEEKLIPDKRTTIVYNYGLTEYTMRDILHQISDDVEYLFDYFLDLFAKLVDIYFLRRFLDKDYITNAIVYCGMAHSINYIHILVNYFGFNITHTAYSELKLNDLMKAVKENEMVDIIPLLSPPEPYQCSDITHFPRNFL